jgi:di/tricarboxylate transporter
MGKRANIISEYIAFIKEHKSYWIIPLLFFLLLMAIILVLGSTAAAPFIYTIF